MKRQLLYTTAFLAVLILSAGAAPKKESTILPARAVDAGEKAKREENSWFSLLADEMVRFRLEPLKSVSLPAMEEVSSVLPAYAKSSRIDESRYRSAAKKLDADYILSHKYEIRKKDKTIHYYLDLVSLEDRRSVFIFEKNIPFDRLGPELDKCMVTMLEKIGVNSGAELKHFRIAALGGDFRQVKKMGELLLPGRNRREARLDAEGYEKILHRDHKFTLAYYLGARAHYKAGQFAAAATHIEKLLDITPKHPTLNLMLIRSLRLAGKYDNAISHYNVCKKLDIIDTHFMLEKALSHEGQKKISAAKKLYRRILQINPKEVTSLTRLAMHYNNAGHYKTAYNYSSKLTRLYPQNGIGFYEHARCLQGLGQTAKALKAAQKAQKLLPRNESASVLLGEMYKRQKNFSAAAEMYETAAKLAPKNVNYRLEAAKAVESDGKLLESYSYLKKQEKKFRENAAYIKTLGLIAFRIDNIKAARSYLETAISKSDNDGEALLTLADCYRNDKEYDKAVRMYKRALPLTNEGDRCRLDLARCYLEKKNPTTAQVHLRKILRKNPPRDAHQLMADAYLMRKQTKSALTHYKNERHYYGATPYLQKQIALIHYDRSELKAARTAFRKLAKIAPDDAQPYYYLTVIALRWGLRSRAENRLEKAEKLGRGSAKVHFLIGNAYVQNQLYNQAVKHYQSSLQLDNDSKQTLLALASAQFKAGKDSDGAQTYINLFKLDPNSNYKYLAEAGHIYHKLGESHKAKTAFKRFVKTGYKEASVNAALAKILYKEREYHEVVSLLKNIQKSSHFSPEHKLMLGHAYSEAGQFENALPLLKSFTSSNPKHARALKLCAVAYEKSGELRNAVRTYETFMKVSDDLNSADYSYHLGTLYEKINNQKKAISHYESNLAKNPKDLRSLDKLARIHFRSKNWEKAKGILQKAAKLDKAPSYIHLMLARALGALGETEASSLAYSHYLSIEKDNGKVWKEYGTLLFIKDEHPQAVSTLSKAKSFLSEDAEIPFMIGKSLIKLGRHKKALAFLIDALDLDRNNTQILEKIAFCHRRLDNTSELMRTLKRWCDLDMKRYDIRLELGELYLAHRQISSAVKVLDVACDLRPSEEITHRLLAQAYEKQNKDKLRLYHLEAASNHAPRNYDNHFQLARYYIGNKQDKKAESHLVRTIELNSNHARAHFEYGRILLERDDLNKAHSVLETAALLNSENAHCLALYAYSALKLGKTKLAQEKIAAAQREDASDPQVLYLTGLINQSSGQKENAKQVMKQALKKSPKDAQYLESMGDLLVEEMKFKEACKHYLKAWERGGFSNQRAFKLGVALTLDRKHKEASDFFKKVVGKNPDHGEAMYRLTDVYCRIGNIKKAKATLERFDSRKNLTWMQAARGRIYEREERSSAAWIAYTAAHRLDPDNPHVNAGFGRLLMNRNSHDSAITYFAYARSHDPQNVEIMMNKATCHEKVGQLTEASNLYEAVVSYYPEYPGIHMTIASLKTKQREYHAAINHLKNGLEMYPKNNKLRFELGRLYHRTSQYRNAIHAYEKSTGSWWRRENVEALRLIGQIYHSKLADDEKAEKYFKKYVRAGGKKEKVDKMIQKLSDRG
ncbi:MAG: tetratricopeptide repeat protein [Chitinispirillaceae bacterium]